MPAEAGGFVVGPHLRQTGIALLQTGIALLQTGIALLLLGKGSFII